MVRAVFLFMLNIDNAYFNYYIHPDNSAAELLNCGDVSHDIRGAHGLHSYSNIPAW